jgi:hypothetical protein
MAILAPWGAHFKHFLAKSNLATASTLGHKIVLIAPFLALALLGVGCEG